MRQFATQIRHFPTGAGGPTGSPLTAVLFQPQGASGRGACGRLGHGRQDREQRSVAQRANVTMATWDTRALSLRYEGSRLRGSDGEGAWSFRPSAGPLRNPIFWRAQLFPPTRPSCCGGHPHAPGRGASPLCAPPYSKAGPCSDRPATNRLKLCKDLVCGRELERGSARLGAATHLPPRVAQRRATPPADGRGLRASDTCSEVP